jgi:hypothetical protein
MTRDFSGLFATISCAGNNWPALEPEANAAKSIGRGNPWMGLTLCSLPAIAPHRRLNRNLGLSCEHFCLVARPQVKVHVAAIAPVLSLHETS